MSNFRSVLSEIESRKPLTNDRARQSLRKLCDGEYPDMDARDHEHFFDILERRMAHRYYREMGEWLTVGAIDWNEPHLHSWLENVDWLRVLQMIAAVLTIVMFIF